MKLGQAKLTFSFLQTPAFGGTLGLLSAGCAFLPIISIRLAKTTSRPGPPHLQTDLRMFVHPYFSPFSSYRKLFCATLSERLSRLGPSTALLGTFCHRSAALGTYCQRTAPVAWALLSDARQARRRCLDPSVRRALGPAASLGTLCRGSATLGTFCQRGLPPPARCAKRHSLAQGAKCTALPLF